LMKTGQGKKSSHSPGTEPRKRNSGVRGGTAERERGEKGVRTPKVRDGSTVTQKLYEKGPEENF